MMILPDLLREMEGLLGFFEGEYRDETGSRGGGFVPLVKFPIRRCKHCKRSWEPGKAQNHGGKCVVTIAQQLRREIRRRLERFNKTKEGEQ